MNGMIHIVEHQVMIEASVVTGGVRVILRPIVFIVAVVGTAMPRICTLLLAATARPAIASATSAFVFQISSPDPLIP